MRRPEKEITDETVIREILVRVAICRLGLVENGEAYIVPVNYVYHDGYLYIHSAAEGRKIAIIRKNPHVSFEIEYSSETIKGEIPCKWGTKYRSLMGTGTITITEDDDAKRSGFDLLMKKYAGIETQPDYDETAMQHAVLLKLKIESITGKQSGVWQQ